MDDASGEKKRGGNGRWRADGQQIKSERGLPEESETSWGPTGKTRGVPGAVGTLG